MRNLRSLPVTAELRGRPFLSIAGLLTRRVTQLWSGNHALDGTQKHRRSFRIVHLGAGESSAILLHYLTLGSDDRQIRFHGQVRFAGLLERCRSINWQKTRVLGAITGNRLVAIAEIALTTLDGSSCSEIAVSVLRPWQNQGLATALLRAAISEVHAQHGHPVILFTQISNRAMVRICRKLGGTGELSRGEIRFIFDLPVPEVCSRLIEEE